MVVCDLLMHLLLNCRQTFQAFGAPTVECPKGINVHKLAATKERAVKIHMATIPHFGFMEKVYGFVMDRVRRNGNSHLQGENKDICISSLRSTVEGAP